jgi:hypothetical protein
MDGECGYHDRCYADFDDGEIGEAYDAVGWPCEQLCGRIVVTCKDCPEVCRYNFNRREATA